MSGAVSGSSLVIDAEEERTNVTRVTFVLNETCQLDCEHCYLPHNKKETLLDRKIIDWVLASTSITDVMIVGMEPFFNKKVANLVAYVGQQAYLKDLRFSLITNGMNLTKQWAYEPLKYVHKTGGVLDISLDGGPQTYDRPKGDYQQIIKGLRQAVSGFPELRVCILNTITTSWDRQRMEDSLSVLDDVSEIHRVIYSPYLDTERIDDGRNPLPSISLRTIIQLVGFEAFKQEQKSVLAIDEYNLKDDEDTKKSLSDGGRLQWLGDPINLGQNIRVAPCTGIDAYVLSPWDALHLCHYPQKGVLYSEAMHHSYDAIARRVVAEHKSNI